ncbi:hypothetical protein OF83DRAFT_1040175, partial [Amylostereum chailletii]
PGGLTSFEKEWVEDQPWLAQCGYMLRPRYRPDWVPSWKAPGNTDMNYVHFEDGWSNKGRTVIDATRMSDGAFVSIKRVDLEFRANELAIGLYFSGKDVASDQRNHCVPVLDVLHHPDKPTKAWVIMPHLQPYFTPQFSTIGEAVAFFTQIFEGIQFMHEHHVAHRHVNLNGSPCFMLTLYLRDCTMFNIMMDASALYTHPPHPVNSRMRRDWTGKISPSRRRTEQPVRYYFVDFGLSHLYEPGNGPPLEFPLKGGDKSAPEHAGSFEDRVPCDPFPTDVYYLGNLVREDFIGECRGFGFMKKLVADMTQNDPEKCPTMHEVVSRFQKIRSSLSSFKLRSRIAYKDDSFLWHMSEVWPHLRRTVQYIFHRTPAIP